MTAPDQMPLVERLRKTAHAMDWGYATSADNMPSPDVLRKVADEIERLTTALEAEKAEVFRLRDALAQAKGVPAVDSMLERAEMTREQLDALPRKLLDVACRIRTQETLFRDDELVDQAAHAIKGALAATPPSPAQAAGIATETFTDQIDADKAAHSWLRAMVPDSQHGVFWTLERKAFAEPSEGGAVSVLRCNEVAIAATIVMRDSLNRSTLIRCLSGEPPRYPEGIASPAQAAGWRDIESAPAVAIAWRYPDGRPCTLTWAGHDEARMEEIVAKHGLLRTELVDRASIPPQGAGWRLIETAPDTEPLSAIVASPIPEGGHFVEEAWWDAERKEWWPANMDPIDAHGEPIYPTHYMPLPAAPGHPPSEPAHGAQVLDVGFRWDGAAQCHIPTLLIGFEPVPANSPCTAKGWADRDALAAKLGHGIVPATPESAG